MKEIYIAIWEDHHADVTVHPFKDLNDAKVWAMDSVQSVSRDHREIRLLNNSLPRFDWVYKIQYGVSDSITITKKEVQ